MAAKPNHMRKRETEEIILDAAIRQFAEKGYDGARVDEIANAAGVNKATIYYHVGEKSKLYERAIDRVIGNIASQVTENIKQAPTHEGRLHAFVTTLARHARANPFFAPVMMREVASGGANLPDAIMRQMMQVFGALFCILDEGKDEGVFLPVNPLLVHMMIVGSLVFYIAGAPIREKISALGEAEFNLRLDVPVDEAAERFADLIVNAVKR